MRQIALTMISALFSTSALATDSESLLPETANLFLTSYPVEWVDFADCDANGVLDLVSTSDLPWKIGVALADHSIEFAPLVTTTSSLHARLTTTGDFDADGYPDLLIHGSDSVGAKFAYFGGVGNGTFVQGVETVGTFLPREGLSRDFDGDGHLDVLFLGENTQSAHVLFGVGDGSFAGNSTVPLGGIPIAMDAADIDGDGALDFAASLSIGVVVVVRNLGSHAFSPVQFVSGGGHVVRLSDLNGDARPDLATLSGAGVTYRPNVPGVGFAGGGSIALTSPKRMDVADLDGDGDSDIVVTQPSIVRVIRNPGNGDFASSLQQTIYPTSPTVTFVWAKDLDGDGNTDIALRLGNSLVYVMRGTGGGQFDVPLPSAIPSQSQIVGLQPVDAGTTSDLVVHGSGGISVLRGDSTGQLLSPIYTNLVNPNLSTGQGALADFDGDGAVDCACSYFSSFFPPVHGFVIARGLGDGNFQPAAAVSTTFKVADLTPSDFNGDGRTDIAYASGGTVWIAYGAGPPGAIEFAPSIALTSGDISAIATGDCSGDGFADLAVAVGSSITIHLGNGVGGFATPIVVPTSHVSRIVASDLDRDGVDEWVLAHDVGSFAMSVCRATVSSGFVATPMLAGVPLCHTLSISDLTGDGWLDVMLANFDTSLVAPGLGDGTFGPVRAFHARSTYQITGDVDANGIADIVAVELTSTGSPAYAHVSLSRPDGPWIVHELGKTGSAGVPRLRGHGTLEPNSTLTLRLLDAAPSAPTFLFVGTSAVYLPALGGVLFPSPMITLGPLQTDAMGQWVMNATFPPGVPPRFEIDLQAWIVDPAASAGVSASNGLRAITP